VLAALLTTAAATAQPAAAVTLVLPNGTARPQPYQHWADRAAVPTTRARVTLRLEECPVGGAGACLFHTAPLAIYLGRYGQARGTLLHELGHAFDAQMSERARARFNALFRDPRPWRSAANSPHERFAEAYRLCAMRPRIARRYVGAYGYTVTPARHRRVCGLIRTAT